MQSISDHGRFEVVAGNARDNFSQSAEQVGDTISQAVMERLQALTELELDRLRPLIERRVSRGRIRDGHGDLHLDHVYAFPERQPPEDLVIIDCIEFGERFRCGDPVADMAFLVMDLRFHGRPDLADCFAAAYFRAAQDDEGRPLLPFYTSYRAAVRGKVEGMKLAETEVPAAERQRARTRARAYWLLALGELEQPARRPCLLLVGGLPGSGKSTLARNLAASAGFQVIRSDVVRKELAGVRGPASPDRVLDEGIYSPDWTDRTYAECLRRAEELLFQGQRVLIDASFQSAARRQLFLAAAQRWGVPTLFLVCQADPAIVRQRLRDRRNDASDADWEVYQHAAARWEPAPGRLVRALDTSGSENQAVEQAMKQLGNLRLA